MRIAPAIEFIHDKEWFHGDVKPSNIFIDSTGLAWLGDYGSSSQYKFNSRFQGGTVVYQCSDVSLQEQPRQFDNLGLVISLLVKLDLLKIENESHTLDKIKTIIYQIDDSNPVLKELLLTLAKAI
jgi:serine/threonine protein kinase